MRWEKVRIAFPVTVDTPQVVVASLRRELRGLARFSWQGWNQAAAYCLRNNVNLDEALEWANQSVTTAETFTNLRTKAGLLEKKGDTKAAEALRAKSLQIANETEMNAYGYQLLGQKKTDEAIEIFRKNAKTTGVLERLRQPRRRLRNERRWRNRHRELHEGPVDGPRRRRSGLTRRWRNSGHRRLARQGTLVQGGLPPAGRTRFVTVVSRGDSCARSQREPDGRVGDLGQKSNRHLPGTGVEWDLKHGGAPQDVWDYLRSQAIGTVSKNLSVKPAGPSLSFRVSGE
jgi:hypothetical protein